jgi:predicted nucleic acid-binding protein
MSALARWIGTVSACLSEKRIGARELIEDDLVLLADNERIHHEGRRLIVTHAVSGVQVHDARLVAAMNVHGVTRLLTFDQRDFTRYPGITVEHPRQVAKLR